MQQLIILFFFPSYSSHRPLTETSLSLPSERRPSRCTAELFPSLTRLGKRKSRNFPLRNAMYCICLISKHDRAYHQPPGFLWHLVFMTDSVHTFCILPVYESCAVHTYSYFPILPSVFGRIGENEGFFSHVVFCDRFPNPQLLYCFYCMLCMYSLPLQSIISLLPATFELCKSVSSLIA